MTKTPPTRHPLYESIERHHIRSVAVVDDAFDQVTLASFQDGEDREFIDAVNEDDHLLQDFHALVSGTMSEELLRPEDLTDSAVAHIWEMQEMLGQGLKKVLSSTLFRVLERKVSQVKLLYSFLKEELGIERVERYGTAASLPGDEFDLAFIDYRFGPSGQATSVQRAVRWAKHLYNKGRTFIILMSAEMDARGRQEYFREESNLTRGLFEFLDKEEIEDSGKFCNRLNSFCAGLRTRHEIHGFATAAKAAADEALSKLMHSIQALGLEDYAYLEQISLREDGHPLGDYMLWLFGEYFAHNLAVNDSLQAARRSVNGIKYDRFLPLQRPPSVILAKMYSAAITEPVYEGWGPHPRVVQAEEVEAAEGTEPSGSDAAGGELAGPPSEGALGADTQAAGVPAGGGLDGGSAAPNPENAGATEVQPSAASMPLYQLGDLLIATKEKSVYLVLNAGCDLQFSPGERDCDVEQSILLIPGRFEPFYERGSETNVKRTELFELGDESYRIIWQHTRAVAVPYQKVLPEYKPKGYERNWRLKLPYALEVQQHFAAQLTRIGVPTPTPVFRELPVEVYGKDANGNPHHLGTVHSGLVIFHHRQRDQFVLTVDCVHRVLTLIDGFIDDVESELSEPAGSEPIAGLPPAEAPKEIASPAAVASADREGKTAKPPERNPATDAQVRARRRKKYLEELKESREALAHTCIFQDSLHNVPGVGGAAPQIDVISTSDKRTRLEVRHAASLSGRLPGNSPVVLIFSVPDVASPSAPTEKTMEPPAPIDQMDESRTEERTQP
jgi:hypothetical protein